MVRDKGLKHHHKGIDLWQSLEILEGEALEVDGARTAGSKKMTSGDQLEGMDIFDTVMVVYPRGKSLAEAQGAGNKRRDASRQGFKVKLN